MFTKNIHHFGGLITKFHCYVFDQMKATCAIHVFHSQQRQSLGDQDLMKWLNLVNNRKNFIWSGTNLFEMLLDNFSHKIGLILFFFLKKRTSLGAILP